MYMNLKAEMARNGITNEQLANGIGINPSTMSAKLNIAGRTWPGGRADPHEPDHVEQQDEGAHGVYLGRDAGTSVRAWKSGFGIPVCRPVGNRKGDGTGGFVNFL